MKSIMTIITFITFISMNGQIDPILEYNWKLEQVVTVDSTLIVPEEIITSAFFYESGEFSIYDYEAILGYCQLMDIAISFDNENENFTITFASIPFGHCGNNEILSYEYFLLEKFIYDDIDEQTLLNPYSYSFTEVGTIIFMNITNNEGSVATYSATTLIDENFRQPTFSIYPNPVGNHLYIQSKNAAIQHIEIFNLMGKRILKLAYHPNESVDVSSLAKGLYVLKIETETGIFTKKLVKE